MPARGQAITAHYRAFFQTTMAPATGAANHAIVIINGPTASSTTNAPVEINATNAPGLFALALTSAETLADLITIGGHAGSGVSIAPTIITFDPLPLTLSSGVALNANIIEVNGALAQTSVALIGANIVTVNGAATQTSVAQFGVNVVTIPALTQTTWAEPANPLPAPNAATLQQMLSVGYALAINSLVQSATALTMLANTSGATIATWSVVASDTQVIRGRAT